MTTTTASIVGPVAPGAHAVVRPAESVRLQPGLLHDWAERNRTATIPHGISELERAGNLENVRRLTGASTAPFAGMIFADSDIHKTLEAIAWQLGREDDAALRTFYDDTVTLLEHAQRDDGYLDSAYQLGDAVPLDGTAHPDGLGPWSDFDHGHELYVLGHLVQAAVAGKRAIDDDRLLGVAQRFVALVIERFGAADSPVYCGHPEIETALVELARLTGDAATLDLAEAFLRRRGSGFVAGGRFGAQYYQDELPVVDTDIMRGHAVRAMYLNAGVADLYLERGDPALLESLERQWNDLVANRLYITGGTGSRHRDEAFGDAYELPSERAYAETCAGIALMNWAWRMYLAKGSTKYLDVFERTFYNVVLAGVSETGVEFFYSNPLQRRGDHGASQQESAGMRLPWYSCACCPPNLMRTFASIEHSLFGRRGDEVQVANFGSAVLELGGGARLTMETSFPRSGTITLTIDGDPGSAFLTVRVPEWVRGAVGLVVDGAEREPVVEDGWLRVAGLRDGSVVMVELPMGVTAWYPHPGADGIRGTVAFSRGPVVYCADQADNASDIERLEVRVGDVVEAAAASTVLGPLLEVTADEFGVPLGSLPLYSAQAPGVVPRHPANSPLVLRPYATWANGATVGAMRVWLPVTTEGHANAQ